MICNISLPFPEADCDLWGKDVPQERFRMFLLLLDALTVFIFHGPQRTLAQLGRDPGTQNGWIERLGQIIVRANLNALRYHLSIRIRAQNHDRNISRIRIALDDL
jgi:hypothetical protein